MNGSLSTSEGSSLKQEKLCPASLVAVAASLSLKRKCSHCRTTASASACWSSCRRSATAAISSEVVVSLCWPSTHTRPTCR